MRQPYCRRLRYKARNKGFTLIEIMIAMLIVAILAAVAIPAYNDSVLKSRRAEGKRFLLEFIQAQERHFTQNNQYATAIVGAQSATNLGWGAGAITSPNGHYTIALQAGATPTAFTAQVVPAVADPNCGTLTLDNLGVRASTIGAVATCWAR